MASIDAVRERFLGLWGRLGPLWGIPPSTARVLAWLISRTDPVAADELVEQLGMSRGAVSMACRELIDWGLVHTEHVPGSRRVLYRAETEPERAIRNIVQTRKRREWDPLLEELRECTTELRRVRSSEAGEFRRRLEDIQGIVGFVEGLAKSFLEGGVLQRIGLKTLIRTARSRRGKSSS